MSLTAKNEVINYNKTPYVDIGRRNSTMNNTAIHEILISLARNLGGKKLSKATVTLESIAPDCSFEIENAGFAPRSSSLLIMDRKEGIEMFKIPVDDIKSMRYILSGKTHFIIVHDHEDNRTIISLRVA